MPKGALAISPRPLELKAYVRYWMERASRHRHRRADRHRPEGAARGVARARSMDDEDPPHGLRVPGPVPGGDARGRDGRPPRSRSIRSPPASIRSRPRARTSKARWRTRPLPTRRRKRARVGGLARESSANAAPVETTAAADVVALNDAPVTAPSAAWEPAGSDAEKSIEADRPSDLKPEAGRSA